jgi:hypothetical protein
LKDIEEEIVEDVMVEREGVVDEKDVELEMMKDI